MNSYIRPTILILCSFVVRMQFSVAQVTSTDFNHESSISQELLSPLRMAIDHNDNLYVTDVVKRCINKFDLSGNFLQTVLSEGYPISLALNYQNILFFGDGATGSIFKVNSDGTSNLFNSQAQFPSSLTFDADGNMYVADSKQKKVLVLDSEGQLINTIGDGTLIYPTGIDYDEKNKRIVVAEHGAARYIIEIKIYIFNLDGTLFTSFSSYGSGDGQLYRAQGVSVGRCGNIYIAEPFQGEISVFSPNGTYITRFGEYGSAVGQLNVPMDVVFNSEDKVITSSMNNGKIEVFSISDNFPSSNMKNSNVTVCEGQAADLPVRFTGTAPWTFTYTVDGANPVTVSNTFDNPYIINTTQPGTYQVTGLADANYVSTCITSNATVTHKPAPSVNFHLTSVTTSVGEPAVIPVTFNGTSPWSFTFSKDGLNYQTLSGITTSSYNLTVTDPGYYQINSLNDLNCPANTMNSGTSVFINTNPTAKIIGTNFSACVGDSAIIPIEFTGTAPWTFTYTQDGGNPVTVSGTELNPYFLKVASSGIYRVTALSDASQTGTLFTGSANVVINPLPSATLVNPAITVCQGVPAPVNIELSGTAPWTFTYQVEGGNSVSVNNVLTNSFVLESYLTGTHTLLSVSDVNCAGTSINGTTTVSHFPRPTSFIANSSVSLCNGLSSTFEIELTGTAPWTLSYSKSGNAPVTISGITQTPYSVEVTEQGSYSVTALNDALCDATNMTGTHTLSIWGLPTAAISSPDATICEGASTDITMDLSGTAPWSVTYTKDGSDAVTVNDITSNIFSIPVTLQGVYQLSNVSDVNCSGSVISGSSNVTVKALPTASFGFSTQSVCQGERVDIPVHFTGTAPWTFSYSKNNTNPVTISSLQEQDFNIVTYVDGTYEMLSVTDANCSTTISGNTAQVLLKTLPTATLATAQLDVCEGNTTNLSIELTGTAPWSFSYSKDGNSPVNVTSVNQSSFLLPVNEAGTYQLTSVADASCSGTHYSGISTVNVKTLPVSSVISPDAALCMGENAEISFGFTGTPPFSFTYTSGFNSISINNYPDNLYSFFVSETGTYEVTEITDASCPGNQMTGSSIVTMNSLPSATMTENFIQACPGSAANIPVNLTGTAPWSLVYTRNGMNPVTIDNISDPNFNLAIPDPGEYEIISVSDATVSGNCIYGTSVVEHLPIPTSYVNNSYPYFCQGEMANVSVTLTGTPPWSFTYTVDGTNPVTISNTVTNVYNLQSTLPGLYEVSAVNDAICPGTSSGSIEKILNLPVTATITDNVVTVPEGTYIDIPVYFTGEAPWSFTFAKDGISVQTIYNTTLNPYNLSVADPGVYSISYVFNDNCGGTSQGNVVLNAFPLPTADIPLAEFLICPGEIASVPVNFTGNGPWTFTYTLNNSNPVTISNVSSNSYLLDVSEPGNYEITAVSDVNFAGTSITGMATVNHKTLPSAELTTSSSFICEGSSAIMNIALTGMAPWSVTYTQDGSNPVTVTDILTNSFDIALSAAGTYELTSVSDANCNGTNLSVPVTISQNALPTAAITTANSSICEGSSANMNIALTGTAPWSVTYTQDGSNPVTVTDILTSSFDIALSSAGTYEFISVSDANCNGTNMTGSVNISQNALPTAAITTANFSICEGSSANMNIALTGSAPWSVTYTQDGSNPVTVTDILTSSFDIALSSAGTYELISVSDANCSGTNMTGSVNISQNALPTAAITTANSTICEGSSANMNIALTGSAPWSVTYTQDGSNPVTVTDISTNSLDIALSAAGTYAISAVSDANCTGTNISGSAVITETPLPVPAFTYNSNALEVSFTNNSINADSYLWNFGDGNTSSEQNPIYTYSQDGTYTVSLTATSALCGDSTVTSTILVMGVLAEKVEIGENILLFPNPSSGIVNIVINNLKQSDVKLEIYSISGQLIYSSVFIADKNNMAKQIYLRTFADGVFTIKIITDNSVYIDKMILKK